MSAKTETIPPVSSAPQRLPSGKYRVRSCAIVYDLYASVELQLAPRASKGFGVIALGASVKMLSPMLSPRRRVDAHL